MSNRVEVLATLVIDRPNVLYREHTQIKYSAKYKTTIEKWTQYMNKEFPEDKTKDKTQTYLIREIQIQTTLRHHFLLFRLTEPRRVSRVQGVAVISPL